MLQRYQRTQIRPVFPAICPHCREAGSFVYYEGVDGGAITLALFSILGVFSFLNAPKKILGCPAPFVQEILNDKHDWPCPECGETNPPDFAICFNCQWENPDITTTAGNEHLPDVGTRHPWEM